MNNVRILQLNAWACLASTRSLQFGTSTFGGDNFFTFAVARFVLRQQLIYHFWFLIFLLWARSMTFFVFAVTWFGLFLFDIFTF